jgi:hypothetical protein
MRSILKLAALVSLLWPVIAFAQETPIASQPPVAPPLVREGDLAVDLVQALNIGTTENEAQAESMLSEMGIAPKNGWIADYPVTPDIFGELWNRIAVATDSGKLPMDAKDAQKALQEVAAGLGLPLGPAVVDGSRPISDDQYASGPPVDDSYYSEGPPVVTYYPPPVDYRYLYAWVPSPFWWYDYWFPGFFILNDFDYVVWHDHHHHHGDHHDNGDNDHHGDGHHGDHHGDSNHQGDQDHNRRFQRVTNHAVDPQTKKVGAVDAAHRGRSQGFKGNSDYRRDFGSIESRNAAASILRRKEQQASAQPPASQSSATRSLTSPRSFERPNALTSKSGGVEPRRLPPPPNRALGRADLGSRSGAVSSFRNTGRFSTYNGMTVNNPAHGSRGTFVNPNAGAGRIMSAPRGVGKGGSTGANGGPEIGSGPSGAPQSMGTASSAGGGGVPSGGSNRGSGGSGSGHWGGRR